MKHRHSITSAFAISRASRAIVAMAALLHLLLVAGFALSLATASRALSADAAQCSGVNLLERLMAQDPASLAKARDEAARIANSASVFWRVSIAGKDPSWLLGTMHSPDPRIARIEGNVQTAFAASTKVIVESTDALDTARMQAAMLKLRDLAYLPAGTNLGDLLPQNKLAALEQQAAARAIPWAAAQRMQPWMIAAAIARPACESAVAGAPVLDQLVANRATSEGKLLIGLESVEEQFRAVAAIPQEFHVNALVDLIELGEISNDVMETTKLLYLEGNTGLMLPLVRLFSPKASAGKGYAEFQEQLIGKRNRIMAERAAPHLAKGGVFMAVGALHLPGDDGLVSLLRAAGYRVEPVAKL